MKNLIGLGVFIVFPLALSATGLGTAYRLTVRFDNVAYILEDNGKALSYRDAFLSQEIPSKGCNREIRENLRKKFQALLKSYDEKNPFRRTASASPYDVKLYMGTTERRILRGTPLGTWLRTLPASFPYIYEESNASCARNPSSRDHMQGRFGIQHALQEPSESSAQPPINPNDWTHFQAKPEAIACAKSICGTADQAKPYMREYQKKRAEVLRASSELPKSFTDKLLRLEVTDERGAELVRNFTKAAVDGPSFKVGKERWFLFNLFRYAENAHLVVGEYDEKGKYKKIDEEQTRKNLAHLPKNEQDFILKAFNWSVDHAADFTGYADSPRIKQLPPRVFLKMRYPDKDTAKAFESEIASIRTRLAALGELDPFIHMLYSVYGGGKILDEAERDLKNGTISEEQMRHILSLNPALRDIIAAHSNASENPLVTTEPPSSDAIVKSHGGKEKALAYAFEKLKGVDKEETDKCRLNYRVNSAFLPSASDLKSLEKDEKKVLELVGSSILPKYSEQTRHMLKSELDAVAFVPPPTVEHFQRDIEKSLDFKIERSKETMRTFESMSPEQQREAGLIFGIFDIKDDEPKEELCTNFQYPPLSDGSYTGLGAIRISHRVASGDEVTRFGTLAHELGHVIKNAITKERASEISFGRQEKMPACLKDHHKEELPPRVKEAIEKAEKEPGYVDKGYYNEEDYADLVAGTAARSHLKINPWCQFLEVENDEYTELSLQRWDGDTHSSDLMRLLHFQFMMKDQLPEACVGVFKKLGLEPPFKSCFNIPE